MGVFSWFRRPGAKARAIGASGGAVAVLEPEARAGQDDQAVQEGLAEQEATEATGPDSSPGVPAARTAPDADPDAPALSVDSPPAGEGTVTVGEQAAGEPASAPDTGNGGVDLGVELGVAELLAAAMAAVTQAVGPAEDSHPQSRPERPDTGDEAMGLMDNLKGKAEELAEELKEKAEKLAGQHNEKIDELVDKAGGAIDKATKGKYSDKIATGTEKAKGAVDGFAAHGTAGSPESPGTTETPGTTGTTGETGGKES